MKTGSGSATFPKIKIIVLIPSAPLLQCVKLDLKPTGRHGEKKQVICLSE